MIIDKVERPYVICQDHGKQLGYVICTHVYREGMPVKHVVRATATNGGGEIGCGKLSREHPQDEVSLICEKCAIQNGFLERLH